jgi:hypothetical protein
VPSPIAEEGEPVELKPDSLIAKMDASLRDMALGDVKRASKPGEDGTGGAKIAGFLLGFCFIDAVAGFHAGRTNFEDIGKNFKRFVKVYMPNYDPDALYKDLRNGLVHSYAIGQTYAFTDLEKAGKHRETKETGLGKRTLLNLEDFITDLEHAYAALCGDIRTDAAQFAKAKARYEVIGLMTVA